MPDRLSTPVARQLGRPGRLARAWRGGGAAALAGLLMGCPQLLDADFGVRSEATGGAANADSGAAPSGGAPADGGGVDRAPSGGTRADGGGAGADGGGAVADGGGAAADGGRTLADAGCADCGCQYGEFSAPLLVTGLGLPRDLWGPSISADGQLMSLSSYDGSSETLYLAERSSETTFSTASDSAMALVNTAADEGTPFLSLDGLAIYFYSSRGGVGDRDLYSATRPDPASPFDNTQIVPGVNSVAADQLPWVSLDERTIYITSTRAGARGGPNIWKATRPDRLAAFGTPSLVDELCSDAAEERPALTLD